MLQRGRSDGDLQLRVGATWPVNRKEEIKGELSKNERKREVFLTAAV